MMAKECEEDWMEKPNDASVDCASKDLLCEHKDSGVPYFAIGLCEPCYKDLENASNGASKEELHASEPESTGKDGGFDEPHRDDDTSGKTHDESESLSDIDDREVDGYLNNEEEKQFKKIIWAEMNREYLEEQAAKEAAAAAAKEAFEANFQNCHEDLQAARELAASAFAAAAKSKKEKKQRRAQKAKNSGPPQCAAEVTRQMMIKKRLSSKVNQDVLNKLFDESAATEKPKKVKLQLDSDDHDKESKLEDKNKGVDELGTVDEYGEGGDMDDMYGDTLYSGNVDETYDYGDDDYGYDD